MIVNSDEAPAQPGDSIYAVDKVVGTVSSAGWGFRVEKNIATGYVDLDKSGIGEKLRVDIIGKHCDATVVDEVLYDPDNEKVSA